MRTRRAFVVASLSLGTALVAIGPAASQQAAAPIARYTVDAGTTSGLGAMGAGGGNPLALLRGGDGQVMHELQLRLGSTRAATGEPTGQHFLPQGAGLGQSVPLVTPRQSTGPAGVPGMPSQAQMPKGRLLLFWGCGEHAPKGQPVVIDFSKLARGQVPPGLFAQGTNLPDEWSVTQSNSKTFGEWPNAREAKQVPARSSLLGAHKVTSTYAPEIDFTLADDFMPALRPTTREMPSGATTLGWNSLPKATGYYAWVMGANPDQRGGVNDMVWWSSASTQQFGGALADWLSPAAVAKLVAARTVMPPSQTSCAIPAEVQQAGGKMLMTQLYAYGPQADFAYPPRPATARTPWKPEWIARVRFRANAMVMTGMPGMSGLGSGGGDEDESRAGSSSSQPDAKPPCPRGLRGVAMRAAGACR